MEYRNPKELRPHPVSTELYGDNHIEDIKESIAKLGILVPLTITEKNIVISGHRRWRCAIELAIDSVPVEVKTFANELEENRSILEFNQQREKTFSQKMNEAELRLTIETVLAEQRKLAGKPIDLTNLGSQGETADIVGQQVGIGRAPTFRKALEIRQEAKQGNPIAKELVSKLDSGEESIKGAYATLTYAEREKVREERRAENIQKITEYDDPLVSGAKFATIMLDPPWDWGDEGDIDQLGRAKPTYKTMPFDELLELPIPQLSDDDCHLYLWITNRSLPKGFALIEKWGFRYITCITWCKPSYGMGNYFRGQTEQLLFAIKGSQPLKRKDVGTWFLAKRGNQHSSKPIEAYELIESCSPSPYLEIFAREKRLNWQSWGADIE